MFQANIQQDGDRSLHFASRRIHIHERIDDVAQLSGRNISYEEIPGVNVLERVSLVAERLNKLTQFP
jgi:hypothetical protein